MNKHEMLHGMSPDEELVERLIYMRDGFCKIDPEQLLARTENMTDKHAQKLLAMLADADRRAGRG